MSDGVTVQVDGLAELGEALDELGPALAKGVLRRVSRKALVPFDKAWRRNVRKLTGTLAESGGIGSNLTRTQRAAHEREDFVETFAGPGALVQAITEEFGTVDQAPQAGVTRAWDEKGEEVLEGIASGLGDEVQKTAARAERRSARIAAKINAGG